MEPADWISLFENPQCSHLNDMMITSLKYGIVVNSNLVTPCTQWTKPFSEISSGVRLISYLFLTVHAQRLDLLHRTVFSIILPCLLSVFQSICFFRNSSDLWEKFVRLWLNHSWARRERGEVNATVFSQPRSFVLSCRVFCSQNPPMIRRKSPSTTLGTTSRLTGPPIRRVSVTDGTDCLVPVRTRSPAIPRGSHGSAHPNTNQRQTIRSDIFSWPTTS
jgi:hypothetical protein